MTNEAKMMVNMAMSIAELNNTMVSRMDLQRHEHTHKNGEISAWYHLDVWFTDGKEFTIREDCTVVIK